MTDLQRLIGRAQLQYQLSLAGAAAAKVDVLQCAGLGRGALVEFDQQASILDPQTMADGVLELQLQPQPVVVGGHQHALEQAAAGQRAGQHVGRRGLWQVQYQLCRIKQLECAYLCGVHGMGQLQAQREPLRAVLDTDAVKAVLGQGRPR